MASPSILISDREYNSGLVTIYYGRTPGSHDVEVFVKVGAEALPADHALVRLAYETITERQLPGEKKPAGYKEQLGDGQKESASTHWPPTTLKERVWIVRRQVVDISPDAFVQTAQAFQVPPDALFTVEVTLMKKIGEAPHRFPSQRA